MGSVKIALEIHHSIHLPFNNVLTVNQEPILVKLIITVILSTLTIHNIVQEDNMKISVGNVYVPHHILNGMEIPVSFAPLPISLTPIQCNVLTAHQATIIMDMLVL